MPWRLIVFIVVFAIFLVFITFNLENKCDISFGFTKLSEVPVFITIFTSFVIGFFGALPLIYNLKKKRPEKNRGSIPKGSSFMDNGPREKSPMDIPVIPSDDPIDPSEARKRFMERKRGKK